MDYDSKSSLLFLACVDKNFTSKISNYFSKLNIFSVNSKDKENIEKGISQLIIYNIIKNNSGETHFEKLYFKNFKEEICYLKYYEKIDSDNDNILVMGFKNGNIELYKIFINESYKITREFVEKLCSIKVHKNPIVGVAINFTIGYIYSVAKENTLNISEINYQSFIKSFHITNFEIKTFFYDQEKLRIYISDNNGSIWIIDILSSVIK